MANFPCVPNFAPLQELLVVDLTRALAGPYCTLMLADLGARVIKVEAPGGGDDTRGWGPPFLGGESAYFLSVNRNKESLTLNLKDSRGKEVLHRLLARADVLVENFRPGIMDRFGLGYPVVHQRYPRLVYCSISGFGQDGPYRERTAYDLILQGMGGLMGMTGEEGGPPVKVGVAIADICAGMFAAFAILVALRVRDRTGRGQWIDAAMLDGQIAWLTYQAGNYFATGENPRRLGSAHPSIVPYQAFRTADGHINVAVGSEAIWERFCAALGREDLAVDPRFRTNPDRVAHRDVLLPLLEATFAAQPTAYWRSVLDAAGVPNGPIYLLSELFADPQVLHRGLVVEMDHPTAGRIRQTGLPVRLSETPGAIRTPPPRLGEHTEAILQELGYDSRAIETLKGAGVV
ncbi:MAG: CaiB/BaiF CoA-transferase family protein [Armatimonadota bacterium]|nr:CaiB/BaiF CoA-transferase family protein [Armatimonadota bacterium]MDR7427391.1 CaiB/BaiF CoA-transferase family protein [Armatimonadota bacterium]MDR7463852.1 CaiB/BaiF CoA-transferase family protein [Armatimonadota bacterium]MDR7470128.1 CaiB/BaiF CoA-transferase family protein [Armatimonadota bacterium]MDR7474978.1 CaiB/BaiF CoA-transferase family protein [Armatimonadota bacterium]